MGHVGRQENRASDIDRVLVSCHDETSRTVDDLDQRIEWSGVLAQLLACVESEKRHVPRVRFHEYPADDCVISILYQIAKIEDDTR